MAKRWCVLFFLISRVASISFPPLELYIGTGGEAFGAGSLPLGAQSPYGALRVGADTSNTEDIPIIYNHFCGYHYPDTHINIFSHTHMVGAGVVDYGEVGVFPVQVDNDDHLQHMIASRNGYRSAFRHESERIEPGFYQVYLDTHKVNVELTATEQVGVHRYSFDKFNENHRVVLVDSSYTLETDACRKSHVNIDPSKNEISGSIFFEGSLSEHFGGVTTYFAITFTNWTDFGVWTNGHLEHGQTVADGCSSGAYVILSDNLQQVTVYVAISFISIEQARTNLQMQTQLQSFDSIRELVQQKWINEISRFEVRSVAKKQQILEINNYIRRHLQSS
jgi:putative alpha-1,2-mannosidase